MLGANLKALRGYLPGPYPGRVSLFRSSEAAASSLDPGLGWRALAAHVDVHDVPGDHHTMVREPHVATLAERLEKALEEAERPNRAAAARHSTALGKASEAERID